MPTERANANQVDATRFSCAECGATLRFQPGAEALVCDHCGHVNPIEEFDDPAIEEAVREHDYEKAIEALREESTSIDATFYKCDACGAEATPPPEAMSIQCPYCGANIVDAARKKRVIEPQALLPFRVTRADATQAFRTWIQKLWFAPTALKKAPLDQDKLHGMYVPYWTLDTDAATQYSGLRGDYYYVTQTYTTMVNGKPQVRTRQVRHTRWSPRAGNVQNQFDDVLVIASDGLPRDMARKLEPWDLAEFKPFATSYLSGFQAERYRIGLEDGFGICRELVRPVIRSTVMSDIGGDVQRITSMDTSYANIAFRHVLMPIWVSAYQHKGKVFRFLVNGRTGEVQSERPWSAWKIASLIIGIVVAAGAIAATIYFLK